jgi:hypothetical protein
MDSMWLIIAGIALLIATYVTFIGRLFNPVFYRTVSKSGKPKKVLNRLGIFSATIATLVLVFSVAKIIFTPQTQRKISDDDIELISSSLIDKRIEVWITYPMSDNEALIYAGEIRDNLISLGYQVLGTGTYIYSIPEYG